MKSVLKIYRRYVLMACLLVVFVVFINLAAWIGYASIRIFGKQNGATNIESVKTGRYQVIADALVWTAEGYRLDETGYMILQDNHCAFALLLDGTGNVVWEWQKPAEIPERFSTGEIGAFSKWYLMDYPVGVWRYGEEGLLVIAYPKGSMVRYNPSWRRDELEAGIGYIGVFILFNMTLVFVLALLFGYRFYRSLKPVGEGIDALAEGKSVRLREKGLTQYLREKINQTSQLLEQQQKELARRDTARTEWIAGVSHDIRTPLSLIMGYADELATQETAQKAVQQKAEVIRTQSLTIKKLIEDLNLTSKLSYHMQPLRSERYVPAVWLRRTIALMHDGRAIPEDCELELAIEPKLEKLFISGDVQLLTRALQNLIGNCVRHNPGGCQIHVKAQTTETGFCLCIKDNGKGVPEKVQKILLSDEETGADLSKNRQNRKGTDDTRTTPGREANAPNLSKNGQNRQETDGTKPIPDREAHSPNGPLDHAPHVMGLRVAKQIAIAHGGRLWFADKGREVWLSVETLPQDS